jgi:hypothetical protein
MAFCFEKKLTPEATENTEGIGFRSSALQPSAKRVPRLASNERTLTWGTIRRIEPFESLFSHHLPAYEANSLLSKSTFTARAARPPFPLKI